MKILIIGAGIGGLAAARALGADGHEVVVFERADKLRTEGAALTLWSNGTGVLSALGVPTEGLGAPVDVLEQHSWDGKVLLRVDLAHAVRAYGHPHLSTPRRDLIQRLAVGVPVAFSRTFTGFDQDEHGVRAHFADGTTESCDLLVGADGYRSAVRGQAWGADPARPSGWSTWQGLSAVDIEITTSRRGLMILGPEGMVGLMPAGNGLLQWWFDLRWTHNPPPLRERFGHWASPVDQVLDQVRDEEMEFFPHYHFKVPKVWSSGRVTVLGDAAHTMPPTVAQGGNQALEDAWALARALREEPSDVRRALARYERARTRRAALTSRVASAEPANQYRPTLSRLAPDAFLGPIYTRWLRMVSTYLGTHAGR
ncbi:FAD-dependent oxidoreductase [Nonomuraea sp. NPDC050556]|uniref:FAD-dependent oxidoreductase n=1 Tax=Nonomuraea sp. NPDC050556 TaxID=3364369 RepID=UPI00379AE9E5